MVFDHMFSLIDSLSFTKKDQNITGGAKTRKNKFNPSLDTAFLVIVVLSVMVIYAFIKIKNRLKKHYRKKYTMVNLCEVKSSAPMVEHNRQIF